MIRALPSKGGLKCSHFRPYNLYILAALDENPPVLPQAKFHRECTKNIGLQNEGSRVVL